MTASSISIQYMPPIFYSHYTKHLVQTQLSSHFCNIKFGTN